VGTVKRIDVRGICVTTLVSKMASSPLHCCSGGRGGKINISLDLWGGGD